MPEKFKSVWALEKENGSRGELYIYGEISDYKYSPDIITPADVKEELDKLKSVKTIDLYVNSPGGSVFAGIAIHNMFRRDSAKIVAHVDGVAASIASVVIKGADKIIMPKNAMIMVHNPWTIAMGYAADFRKMADDLDQVKEALIVSYLRGLKIERDELSALMDSETWMTGDEAVAKGFADVLEEEKKIAASVSGNIFNINGVNVDSSKFKSFPTQRLAALIINQPQKEEAPKTQETITENNFHSDCEMRGYVMQSKINRFILSEEG